MSQAAALLHDLGFAAQGPVRWAARVICDRAGVYVVELDQTYEEAPIDRGLVAGWLTRFPAMTIDGHAPSVDELVRRLSAFWLPSHTIIYLGCTTVPLSGRVAAYYRTPLGDRSPHRGGYWVKTLSVIDRCSVWWAIASDPEEAEGRLLDAFAIGVPEREARALHDPDRVLPFANLSDARKVAKKHGLRGATQTRRSGRA